jgi:hypothetical protein
VILIVLVAKVVEFIRCVGTPGKLSVDGFLISLHILIALFPREPLPVPPSTPVACVFIVTSRAGHQTPLSISDKNHALRSASSNQISIRLAVAKSLCRPKACDARRPKSLQRRRTTNPFEGQSSSNMEFGDFLVRFLPWTVPLPRDSARLPVCLQPKRLAHFPACITLTRSAAEAPSSESP